MVQYSELVGRSVVVTGSAGGIGEVAARAFYDQGAYVFLLDIDSIKIEQIASELGDRAFAKPVDLTDPLAVKATFASIFMASYGLDILINCAGGYSKLQSIEEMDLAEWDQTIALNLRSVFLCCQAAIPGLKKSKAGRIINVTSISGRTVHAVSSPAYGAAKAGVTQLSKFLAYELGPFGITTNNIAPLTTLTPRVKALRSQEDIDRIALQVPMRRLATEDDHVYAMLYLASNGASFVNGTTIDTNGGRIMM
jgi:3-oxoacyl-[acyl-carrier protein] reductase